MDQHKEIPGHENEALLKIGELADLAGISPKALRIYDDLDLIQQIRGLLNLVNHERPTVCFKKQTRVFQRQLTIFQIIQGHCPVFLTEQHIDSSGLSDLSWTIDHEAGE